MCINEKRYNVLQIRKYAEDLLKSRGLESTDAFNVVDSMLEADICGVSTHGIRMLPSYMHKIDEGHFSFDPPVVEKSTASFTVLDCKNNIGAVSACKAVDIVAQRASESGLHVVFAHDCNTYGPAFYYADLLAKKGLIGFTCCNAPAAMPAFNGLQALLGTNPLAFACPSKSCGSIVFDMATSVVAKSRFETARIKGEKLPEGWALDQDGNPTTDPVEAIKGFILPMAGFKGYGIALMIDIISGFLSGASYLNKVGKFYSQNESGMNVGQFFMAIDPKKIFDGDFESAMDDYILTIRDSKSIPGKSILIPGDDRNISRQASEEQGIVLSADTVTKLSILFGKEIQ